MREITKTKSKIASGTPFYDHNFGLEWKVNVCGTKHSEEGGNNNVTISG